ncbi:MAG: DNA-binding response regulator, AraC family [Cytophagales bacterium]|jgi:signal transduction histidine kinase/ligand-binding sensor domain-containing protein/CheY-like chemotaxis protein|nr:response regulator [Bacteroidota bacterium]MBS1981711.1 response regulator [Bacteroidota bacterium]WHZ09147.1 MAG: DNA-binding response regulator, AraC family [Cytophagales bacterium]
MSLLLLLFTFFYPPQDSGFALPYQHVGKEANISNSAITSVYMDKFEYVWLGTWDGLDRYDGSNIKIYKPDSYQKGTISNNVIRDVLEDGAGNLWVITHRGINLYNRDTETFSSYLDSLNDVPFLEYNIRACIGPDSALWVSNIGEGIKRYNKNKKGFEDVEFKDISAEWLTQVINIGCYKGLFYMLGKDGKIQCCLKNQVLFSKQISLPDPFVYHKFLQLNDQYFMCYASNGNLIFFNLSNIVQETPIVPLGNTHISSLSESMNKQFLWVGTESGQVFKIITYRGLLKSIRMDDYFPILKNKGIKILSISETIQDLIWVGTDGDGVYKFLNREKMFYSISAGSPQKKLLSHSIIRSIYEDNTGTLFIGTRGGGVNILEKTKDHNKIINTKNGLSNNAVLSLKKDHTGNLWIGVDGEGIDMLESKTNRLFHFPRDFENKTSIMFSSVYAICVDSYNDLWLGTSGYGVIHLKITKTKKNQYQLTEFDQIKHSSDNSYSSIKSNIVYTILEDKPNSLWFGTRGGGIYRYNTITKKIEEHIEANIKEKIRLCNNDVLSLFINDKEELWVGTSGGLSRLSLKFSKYQTNQFTAREGLVNNTIHGIQEDKNSNIWLSTNRGLVMYNRKTNLFTNFDNEDGLLNSEYTDGASFASRISENLYFGGTNGLDIIQPSKLSLSTDFPKLVINDFVLYNKPVKAHDENGVLQTNIDFVTKLQLKYNQNFISFSFTTLDYWNKEKSKFSYVLENFDKGWNDLGPQQSISLTNIPPGQYNLKIKYTNENGVWCTTPKTLSIVITPPFWKTIWAYLLYVLIVIGIQVLIVLYIRFRSRTKKAAAIERYKVQQQKELNDYKLRFYTNIAHEFRTPLTLILGPVSSLLQKNIDQVTKSQLNIIYSNSIRLQKLIEELIQFRKIESGKDKLELSSIDLIPFIQQIIESFQQYAAKRDIHLEFHTNDETLLLIIDVKKIEKILINLISNAIKYSYNGGKVIVVLEKNSSFFTFIIKDEGVGIAAGNVERIFDDFYHTATTPIDEFGFSKSTGIGLSLTKSLVSIHGGKIDVVSKEGKGSTFSISIPVLSQQQEAVKETETAYVADNLGEKISQEFEHNMSSPQQDKAKEGVNAKSLYSILVVDDNNQITDLLESMLSSKYTVYKASDGKKALAVLDEERVDLVISDVLMPDMDGLALCKKIKENIQTSHISVILLTAKVEIENRIEGLQVGADSYIPKPFHPEHLFIRIEKLLERMELIRKKFQMFGTNEFANSSFGISEREDIFFSKIISCIQKNLSKPDFNADEIGEEVGMSKASLYKKVKTMTGLTPHGLIKQYRLKKAAELLKNSTMSVSEVIYETGFNSRSYFYKSFNEMFHCHPKDFNSTTIDT